MIFRRTAFWIFLMIYWCQVQADNLLITNEEKEDTSENTYTMLSKSISLAVNKENHYDTCSNDDFACLALASNDKLGLEAIKALHKQLDDDANGNIDLSETGDFLREDLKIDSGYEKRQKVFHFNDDMHISVKELWEAWLRSEVHNWTLEQTTEWLVKNVELPQYVDNFIRHRVNGANLPRLAANNNHYLSVLGIKDPIHKQKISLKAMDVVLFGPPKDTSHFYKDLIVVGLIIAGIVAFWTAVQQNKKYNRHIRRMVSEMENLQHAEKELQTLQKELELAKQQQESVESEKEDLAKKLQKSMSDSNGMHIFTDAEVNQLRAENEALRHELMLAQVELKDSWCAPPSLQQWLQLTYEIENKAYIKKKLAAEIQLQQAREACEKLRRKRSSLVGAFVSTHGKSIDDVDKSIVEARSSLKEVTFELQERVHRWKEIERLCNCNIMANHGLKLLENALYKNNYSRNFSSRGRMNSQDDLDDDTSSQYAQSTGQYESHPSLIWKEVDSSGSETSKQEEDINDNTTTRSTVSFLIGGETSNWTPQLNSMSSSKTISNNNVCTAPQKSLSLGVLPKDSVAPLEATMQRPKAAFGDSSNPLSLENRAGSLQLQHRSIKKESAVVEEDVYSDSSVVESDDSKKKKRKLFGFGKKSKTKEKD